MDSENPRPSRRQLCQGTLGLALSWSFLGTLAACDAFPDEISPIARAWLLELDELARSVKDGTITQVEWQDRVEQLYARVELTEILALLDPEELLRRASFDDARELGVPFRFPRFQGLPAELGFRHPVFALRRGQSIPAHGHDNMVTSFLVLSGSFHARHFDRLEDEPEHMIVRSTIDATFTPGSVSTISDFRDNVHWFVAQSDTGLLFNTHIHHIDPAVSAHGRVFIDPDGEPLDDGSLRVSKLTPREAFALAGHPSIEADV
jgi:hypothetical protein